MEETKVTVTVAVTSDGDNGGNSKQAVNQFLLDGLRLLQEKYEPEADLLQARYLDGDSVQQIANRMNVSESNI